MKSIGRHIHTHKYSNHNETIKDKDLDFDNFRKKYSYLQLLYFIGSKNFVK